MSDHLMRENAEHLRAALAGNGNLEWAARVALASLDRAIRALPVAEAADDEEMVEVARKALARGCPSSAFDLGKCNPADCSCRDDAMTIIAALREAGALR